MTDITPKSRLEGQRGHVIHTRPWAEIADHYTKHGGTALTPMLHLIEGIASSPASGQLFGATSMFDLLLSDCENFRFGDSTLRIAYRPAESLFEFRHHTFSGHDDCRTCAESEGLQTLRLFLRLKFGIFV